MRPIGPCRTVQFPLATADFLDENRDPSMAALAPQEAGRRATRQPQLPFRPDIQGLRAVAVSLVLLFHAGVPAVSGGYVGVDVFFVLSGYLITGLMLAEIAKTGRLDLAHFYARRVRRLLPAATVTLVGVAVATVVFLPVNRWGVIAGDIAASTLYVVNWRLADRATDYMAADDAASPLQHFWSLAIEEQFYVVWPLLLVLLLLVARRRLSRRGVGWALGGVLCLSLGWSVLATGIDPNRAYLVSTTRVWELATGALLALCAGRLARLPLAVRVGSGWVGLALVLIAATQFGPGTAFPGAAAIVPVGGASLVLLAGAGDGRGSLAILSKPPLQDVGALSYSLYLWHWPMLVIAGARWGGADQSLTVSLGLLVVAASAVPAWVSYRLVERPIHTSQRLRRSLRATAGVGVGALGLGLLAALFVHTSIPAVRELDAGESPGAKALVRTADGWRDTTTVALDAVVPSPADAHDSFDWTCETTRIRSASMDECELFQMNEGPRVAAVGDSHLQHWLPSIRHTAEAEGWRLTVYIMQGCPLGSTPIPFRGAPFDACEEWNREVQERIDERQFDIVLVGALDRDMAYDAEGVLREGEEGLALLVDGYVDAWSQVVDGVGTLVVIRGTPAPEFNVPECLAQARSSIDECAFEEENDSDSAGTPILLAADRLQEARVLDLNDVVCPERPCPAVIGGVLVYRDGSHLTSAYVETLSAIFHERLLDVLSERSRVSVAKH